MSHYGTELQRIAGRPDKGAAHWSVLGLARAAGVNHSILCRYISGRIARPSRELLAAITAALVGRSRRDDAAALLCEHLTDEIEASGLLPGEDIAVGCTHRRDISDDELAGALARIRTRALRPGTWRDIIVALGVLAESADEEAPARLVAESGGEYRISSGSKRRAERNFNADMRPTRRQKKK
jgi:hypothetical protein